jgi:hypothetical protein
MPVGASRGVAGLGEGIANGDRQERKAGM